MNTQRDILFSIVRANAIISRNLQLNGLDFADYMIMHFLHETPVHRLRRIDVAEKLGLTASGATRMLMPLEKRNIVKTEKGSEDARTRYAALTGPGKLLYDEATQSLEMRLPEMFEGTSAHDSVQKVLEKIMNMLTENEYAKEAEEKWGNTDAYAQSAERVKKMSKEEMNKIKLEGEELLRQIASFMDRGVESEEVQVLIKKHYENLNHFYTPTFEMYAGLADMYVDDDRFNAYFEKFRPGLAVFMRDAMKVFVTQK